MRHHRIIPAVLCLLAGACFWRALADTTLQIVGPAINYVHYDAPNEKQIKYKLSYSSADPVGGNALLKTVKIEQFAITGGNPQMVAETPECLYDQKHSVVDSAATLQVHAQDGKFFVEGTGFFLRITNSSLVISNDVHSILQLQADTNTPATTTEIFSHRAEYQPKSEATNGLAIYEGSVRVQDPRLKLTSEILIAELPKDQTNRVNHIVAETNVVIDFVNTNGDQIHTLSQKAVYDRVIESKSGAQSIALRETAVTNETLELTGNPRINLTNGWMTADDFRMNRATGKLRGNGNFHFHYPILTTNRNASQIGAPAETVISSDQFEFDLNTRFSQFWGHIRVDDPRMQMTSESLAANLPQNGAGQSGRPDHIVAETNVVIHFSDEKSGQKVHATGEKAVYDYRVVNGVTNEVLELTGKPAVESTGTNRAGWMTADVITVDRAQGRIWGVGNHHSVLKMNPGKPVMLDKEIFSDRFDFAMGTGLSVYEGSVRAYDPAMNLTSKKLTLKLGKDINGQTNRLENADAVGNVTIDFIEKPFAAADVTNLPSFAAKLKQPMNAISRYVASQLSAPTLELLAIYQPAPQGVAVPLKQALALDLNRLVESGAVYESARFTNIYLSLDTTTLLHQQPLGTDLVQLNRLLLLDAFRGDLARGRTGEKILATGDRAIYSSTIENNTTNVVLNLSGHPKLEKPNEVVTADDTIIYNRTTGVTHFIGRPHLQVTVDGLAKMPGSGGNAPK